MRITDIKQQVKRKDRYSIFLEGKYSFALSETGLLNSGLRIDQELSEEDLKKLKEEANNDKAIYRVLDLISRRPRSEGEIRDYLKRKQYSEEDIENILNMLSIKGYINDEDFARRWVESRRLLKPISKRKLRLELSQKRISDEIINQILDNDETDEVEVIKELIIKKKAFMRYQDQQKLMQFLARQGFNYADIKRALSEIEEAD